MLLCRITVCHVIMSYYCMSCYYDVVLLYVMLLCRITVRHIIYDVVLLYVMLL